MYDREIRHNGAGIGWSTVDLDYSEAGWGSGDRDGKLGMKSSGQLA